MPFLLQVVVGLLIYSIAMRNSYGQGASHEERGMLSREVWRSLNQLLTDARGVKDVTGNSSFWIAGGGEPIGSRRHGVCVYCVGTGLYCVSNSFAPLEF